MDGAGEKGGTKGWRATWACVAILQLNPKAILRHGLAEGRPDRLHRR